MQSKDRASQGTKAGPSRQGEWTVAAVTSMTSDGGRDSVGLEALGEKPGSWVGLQMVGPQLHLALPLGDNYPTPHQQQKDSLPGLSRPVEAEILSGLCLTGWCFCGPVCPAV